MADDHAHDPAGPQSDPDDTREVTLAGIAEARAEPHAGVAVMESPPAEAPAGDLPVWSFAGSAAPRGAASPSDHQVDDRQDELPLGPRSEVSPPATAARPQPLLGPVGRSRPPLLVALLSVVTLGVYALVWHHRINRELDEFDPKLHSRPTRSAVAVAVPWLIGMLVTIAGGALIAAGHLSIALPFSTHVTATQAYYLVAGLLAVPYLVLLLPFSVVAVVMTLERLRSVEEHMGTTTDRQVRATRTVMLLTVPVIGGLLLIGRVQRRLNVIWDAAAPAGRVSR